MTGVAATAAEQVLVAAGAPALPRGPAPLTASMSPPAPVATEQLVEPAAGAQPFAEAATRSPDVVPEVVVRTDEVLGRRTGLHRKTFGERPAWEQRYRRLTVAVDLVAASSAALGGFGVRFGASDEQPWGYLWAGLLMPIAWVACMAAFRGYESRFLFVGTDEYRRIAVVALTLTAAVAVGSYSTKAEVPRGYVLAVLLLVLGLDIAGRYALRRWLQRHWRDGLLRHRVVLVGYERSVATICRRLVKDPRHGLHVVAACLPEHRPRPEVIEDVGVPVAGTFSDVVAAVRSYSADTVAVLACPEMDGLALRRLAWHLERSGTRLLLGAGLMDVAAPRTTIRAISGFPLLQVEHAELAGVARAVKSAIDRAVAAVALLLLSPLLALLAVLIRETSPGPAFFRQTRVGKDGREFTMYKFRTMRVDAEALLPSLQAASDGNGVLFKMRDDPRVTPVGRWLRRLSLDELPQLINVVLGDMSLVGPRPPLPKEVAQYDGDVRRRLAVKPGLTGLWQVSGRSDLAWEDSVRLDVSYVENWTLWLDLSILWRTFSAVVRGTGAY